MATKNPYHVIKHLHVTEKSTMLGNLKSNESNPSVRKFVSPKYVFIVDKVATKVDIAAAIEEIYKDKKVKVTAVNTLIVKPKKRRVRGRQGMTDGFKKAVVTLQEGDEIE